MVEAGARMEAAVLGQTNGCRQAEEPRPPVAAADRRSPRAKGANGSSAGVSFSKELISFSLYGKIPRKSKRPWNESLSSKIAEVQGSFKNIPSMLYFSPSSVTFDGIGVYAAETLPEGTMLGPYYGKPVKKEQSEEEAHEWLWEVYQDSSLAYFIDASDPKYGNWMNFIQCARNQQEQNLKALQYGSMLYFKSVRDVTVGEELLVWYDELEYDIYMGIPVGYKGKSTAAEHTSQSSPTPERSYPGPQHTSENSEDLFPPSYPTPNSASECAPGSGHSDTGSASTDDSGIGINFEQGGSSGLSLVTTTATARPVGDARGGSTADITSPMETFPPEHKSAFQTVTPNNGHSNLTSSALQITHGAMVEPFTSFSQTIPIKLPIYVPAVQQVSGLKVATVEGTQRLGVRPVSLPSSTAVGPGMMDIGKETGSGWTAVAGGLGSPASSSQQQLSPSQHQIEIGLGQLSTPLSQGSAATSTGLNSASRAAGAGGGGGGLLYNMFVRLEDGRWQCIECKRYFSSQGSLRAHARIHTGERPYQCQYCYRTFCQASTLRSHERLHTGEKPYKCEHCGRAFTQSAGLRSHLKTHRYDS